MTAVFSLGRADPVAAVSAALERAGLEVFTSGPIQHGHQFRVVGGVTVNVYGTGKAVVQGPSTAAAEAALRDAQEHPQEAARRPAGAVQDSRGAATSRKAVEPVYDSPDSPTAYVPHSRHPEWTEESWGRFLSVLTL